MSAKLSLARCAVLMHSVAGLTFAFPNASSTGFDMRMRSSGPTELVLPAISYTSTSRHTDSSTGQKPANNDRDTSMAGDRASKVSAPKALDDAAALLHVAKDKLEICCTTRKMQVTGQAPITIGLGAEEAKAARDALAKFIYESLFLVSNTQQAHCYCCLRYVWLSSVRLARTTHSASAASPPLLFCLCQWIVDRINKSIGNGGAAAVKGRSVGILDIFVSFLFPTAAVQLHSLRTVGSSHISLSLSLY